MYSSSKAKLRSPASYSQKAQYPLPSAGVLSALSKTKFSAQSEQGGGKDKAQE